MNLAQPIALYLSLWRSLNPDLPVPFPGTAKSWPLIHTDAFQDQVAKMHIYVSLHPEKTAGGSFNISDADQGKSWQEVWPGICNYFGLKATGPSENGTPTGESWVKLHEDKWSSWEQENRIKQNILRETAWVFLTQVAYA
jgi:hypothetical protein